MDFALDEQNQFLDPDLRVDSEWRLYDHWSLDLAVTLIAIGCDLDTYESTFEVCCDWQDMVRVAREKCKRIALTSVSAGTINDPDTPANWIAWAKAKGYKTQHLEQPQTQPEEIEPAAPAIPATQPAAKPEEPAKPSASVMDYANLPDEQWIDFNDVKNWLKKSRSTLNRDIDNNPDFPKPIKDGNRRKWKVIAIKQYIAHLESKP